MIVRGALEDVSQIYDIERASLDYAWSQKEIKEEILKDGSIYLVFKEENRVLGAISARIILDDVDINNVVV